MEKGKGKGSKDDANSYRPISVISHFAKILEKCVQYQLMSFLSKYDMITPDQSAYLRHHSTQTALLKVTNQWYENIEDGLITGVCFCDISKHFDSARLPSNITRYYAGKGQNLCTPRRNLVARF